MRSTGLVPNVATTAMDPPPPHFTTPTRPELSQLFDIHIVNILALYSPFRGPSQLGVFTRLSDLKTGRYNASPTPDPFSSMSSSALLCVEKHHAQLTQSPPVLLQLLAPPYGTLASHEKNRLLYVSP
jgi:hypothetical protein